MNDPLPYPVCASHAQIVDRTYEDFDLQSQQLSGCDQRYFQLSPGSFQGRFLSVELGARLSFHFEHANRRLQQFVGFPAGLVSLGLVFSDGEPFLANGIPLGRDDLMLCRPGGELNLISPPGGAIMALCLEQSMLAAQPGAMGLSDLFEPRRGSITIHTQPSLATRLREDVLLAIEACRALASRADPAALERLEQTTIACILGQLGLFGLASDAPAAKAAPDGYGQFRRTLGALMADREAPLDYAALMQATGLKRRSLQLVLARHLRMTPSQFSRTVRLNGVRRTLVRGLEERETIGDVAERFGFSSWSKFSRHYADLFGELPSVTRGRFG